MCTLSTVLDGWRDPTWPKPSDIPWTPNNPHQPNPLIPGPNSVPWPIIATDPVLAAQMLEILRKLEAIDERLGQVEKCIVAQADKERIKAELKKIADGL